MLDLLSTYSEALFGFLGVILGGVITFFTERHFRKIEQLNKSRINYILSMNQLSKVYSQQYVLLKGLAKHLPEHQPDLFVQNVLPSFSNSLKPVNFDNERLISLAVKKKTFFTNIQLCFARYDAVIQLFSDYQNARNILEKHSNIEELRLNNNSAVVSFDLNDTKVITDFVTAENLLRALILHLNENITDCRKLLVEINKFGHKKYKTDYEFLELTKLPSYFEDIKEINVGDLPPFQNRNE